MNEYDRRKVITMLVAGIGSAALVGKTSAGSAERLPPLPGGRRVQVSGSAPLLPDLAKLMPETPGLMASLATEFAPLAVKLSTQDTYWLAINAWITDRLTGPIMEGKTNIKDLGEQAWAVYASSYWGGIELRENWGMPPVFSKLGITMEPPFTEFQQGIADKLTRVYAALESGGDRCLEILPQLMRENIVHIMAYNAGCVLVMTEDPPVGQRFAGREAKPAVVRINTRDFMRVDYDLPVPGYLKVWRSAYERAIKGKPEVFEKLLVGGPGEKDLREIWQQGVSYCNSTWGGGATDSWSDAYFEDSVPWTLILNFGLEAVALAAFVAVINQDREAARRAVMAHALYAGATPGWGIGLLDKNGKLPTVS